MSTLDYYRSSLRLHEEGLILADRLLSQWERISLWMVEYARLHNRNDQSSPDGDWQELLRQFAPGFNDSPGSLPDNGGVLCALHEVLDTLGGCQGVRTYYS
ncbi:MAG: hypothetical protein NUV84_00975 [Candidatus Uhrbacteria bacterium]|nr:hypothetical protein [Candidatus Uhrbacteria bacterium]